MKPTKAQRARIRAEYGKVLGIMDELIKQSCLLIAEHFSIKMQDYRFHYFEIQNDHDYHNDPVWDIQIDYQHKKSNLYIYWNAIIDTEQEIKVLQWSFLAST